MHFRLNGTLLDTDTGTIASIVSSARISGSFINTPVVYSNGMAYTAVSLFLENVTGLSGMALQAVLAFVFSLVGVVAFVAYRALLRSSRLALLAGLMIFLIADFLFVVRRGSHEKITWTFLFLLLFLLARGFAARRSASLVARYTVLFYIVAFALISTNSFFASSFISTMLVSLVGGSIFLAIRRHRNIFTDSELRHEVRRLAYIVSSCLIIFFVFTFYLYPPVSHTWFFFKTLLDRLTAILSGFESSSNPYEYVVGAWANSLIYLLLTSYGWFVAASSFIIWIVGVLKTMHQRKLSETEFPLLLLWLVYGAFGLQIAFSLIGDTSNFASNLQVRLFVPMMLVAVPLFVFGLNAVIPRLSKRVRKPLQILAIIGIAFASVTTVLKATNEQLFSNVWLLYSPAEYSASSWTVNDLSDAVVWAGMDLRLPLLAQSIALTQGKPEMTVQYDGYEVDVPGTRYFLFSQLERERWLRAGRPLPYMEDMNIVYTNGQADVYHIRPRTPYQR